MDLGRSYRHCDLCAARQAIADAGVVCVGGMVRRRSCGGVGCLFVALYRNAPDTGNYAVD